nr:MAG TPA: hypothetical protein [Caudoviricetes sp.]DAL13345.1 MAG TPA_asm: hypothetical protein [Caudoviricetes sp.]
MLSTMCLRTGSIKGRRRLSCLDLWPRSSPRNAIRCK